MKRILVVFIIFILIEPFVFSASGGNNQLPYIQDTSNQYKKDPPRINEYTSDEGPQDYRFEAKKDLTDKLNTKTLAAVIAEITRLITTCKCLTSSPLCGASPNCGTCTYTTLYQNFRCGPKSFPAFPFQNNPQFCPPKTTRSGATCNYQILPIYNAPAAKMMLTSIYIPMALNILDKLLQTIFFNDPEYTHQALLPPDPDDPFHNPMTYIKYVKWKTRTYQNYAKPGNLTNQQWVYEQPGVENREGHINLIYSGQVARPDMYYRNLNPP